MAMVDGWDPEDNASVVEDPEEDTPEPEPEETQEENDPEGRLYAGRYRSVEEMERGVEEAQSLIGRQGNELGELKKVVADLQARFEEGQEEEDPLAEEFWNVMPQDKFVELLAENPAGVIGVMADRIAEQKVAARMAEIEQRLEDQGTSIETQQLVNVVADWMGTYDDQIDDDDRMRMQDVFTKNQDWFYDDLASGERARVHNAMSAIATLAGVGRNGNGQAAGATRVPRTAPSTSRPATGGNRGKSVGDQILDAMAAYGGVTRMGLKP